MMSLTKRCWIRAIHTLDSERDSQGKLLVHGHHCAVDVSFQGDPHSESGLLISRDVVDQVLKEHIVDVYDRKNLNTLLEVPSGEFLVQHMFEALKKSALGDQVFKVVLYETPKNKFIMEQT